MMPRRQVEQRPYVDVTEAMDDRPRMRAIPLTPSGGDDPFAEVQI